MKKIIAALALMLAVGYTANAQKRTVAPQQQLSAAEKQESYKQAALKDVKEIQGAVQLNAEEEDKLLTAFVEKHKEFNTPGMTSERKINYSYSLDKYVLQVLGNDKYDKLKASGLLKRLTGETGK